MNNYLKFTALIYFLLTYILFSVLLFTYGRCVETPTFVSMIPGYIKLSIIFFVLHIPFFISILVTFNNILKWILFILLLLIFMALVYIAPIFGVLSIPCAISHILAILVLSKNISKHKQDIIYE